MAKLVYIPSINPDTWLHLTHQGKTTFPSRDYSKKSWPMPPVPIRNPYTYSQFESMLSNRAIWIWIMRTSHSDRTG